MVPTQVLLLAVFFSFSCARVRNDDYDLYSKNYWDNWSQNLNREIQQNVRSGLSGLNNLGSTISQQVRDDLADSFGSASGSTNPRPPNNPQSRGNFPNLDNLGSAISQQVHEGLRPVREMQTKLKIKNGDGGTTIATFKDKRMIVRDGVSYECGGTISETDGSCSGTLRRPSFTDKRDFCYANINSVINNWYCITNGGGVQSGYVNGRPYCNGYNNNPTLLISSDEYRNLCGDGAYPVTYKYFGIQPIGEHSSDVRCSNGTPYTCTYTENRNPNVVNVGTSSIYVSN